VLQEQTGRATEAGAPEVISPAAGHQLAEVDVESREAQDLFAITHTNEATERGK
jgi:hypothetical protein